MFPGFSEACVQTESSTCLCTSYYAKVYWRILGPVYDNENENWRILTNKEIYASVKKSTIIETIRLKITLVSACTDNGRK